jgi:8-oxo-dGTP pyrophosphatase MutT (NUDIX family)
VTSGPWDGRTRARPAATVALLRTGPSGPEVLLTHRPSTMAFGPGLHVFPGGALDPADGEAGLVARSRLGPEACAAAWAGDPAPAAAAAMHRGISVPACSRDP